MNNDQIEELVKGQMDMLRNSGYFLRDQVGNGFDVEAFQRELKNRISGSAYLSLIEKKPQPFQIYLPQRGIREGEMTRFDIRYDIDATTKFPLLIYGLVIHRDNQEFGFPVDSDHLAPPSFYLNVAFEQDQSKRQKPLGEFAGIQDEHVRFLDDRDYMNHGLTSGPQSTKGFIERLQLELERAEERNRVKPGIQTFKLDLEHWDYDQLEKYEHRFHYAYDVGKSLDIRKVTTTLGDFSTTLSLKHNNEFPSASKLRDQVFRERGERDLKRQRSFSQKRRR